MPSQSKQMFAAWSNYNLTVGQSQGPYSTLAMTIENLFNLHCCDVDEAEPIATIAATGTVLLAYLAELESLRTSGGPPNFPPREFAAATVGQAWSFAPLVGTPVAQLLADGLCWSGQLAPELIDSQFNGDRDTLVIAGGGTRLRELVAVAEAGGLSVPTGGSHLGQSLAGSFGTGTHGSRLGQGGVQNIVRAMHIVTGPTSHVWLQPRSAPVLSNSEIANIILQTPQTQAGPGQFIACTPISDDDHFGNALIHLGGMGIVNAVVVELVAIERFNVMAIDRPIDDGWLKSISSGNFSDIAARLGLANDDLQFYELTIDPHDPLGPHAAHVTYTLRTAEKMVAGRQGTRPVAGDLTSGLFSFNWARDEDSLLNASAAKRAAIATDADTETGTGAGPDPIEVMLLQSILASTESSSAFEHYRKSANFCSFPGPIDPNIDAVASGSWGEIHGDRITGGMPGALYNASFAIDRQDTACACHALAAVARNLAPSFVFTMRFVDAAAGTLAFTRFPHSTVIEIDGLSSLAIDQFRALYEAENPQPNQQIIAAFKSLATTLDRGAMAVRAALDAARIDFSMHWAKLGNLDAAKVAADYRNGQIAAWQATRNHLLDPAHRKLFSNPALEQYGLV